MNINYVLSTLSSLALFIVLTLFSVPVVYANPVPAFCMLGVLNHDADWAEACEGISSIYERDLTESKDVKRYSLFVDSVYERDLATRKDIKRYSMR